MLIGAPRDSSKLRAPTGLGCLCNDYFISVTQMIHGAWKGPFKLLGLRFCLTHHLRWAWPAGQALCPDLVNLSVNPSVNPSVNASRCSAVSVKDGSASVLPSPSRRYSLRR